jgi:hypothetical protein
VRAPRQLLVRRIRKRVCELRALLSSILAVAIDGGETHAALANSAASYFVSVAPSLETKVALVIGGGVFPFRLSYA